MSGKYKYIKSWNTNTDQDKDSKSVGTESCSSVRIHHPTFAVRWTYAPLLLTPPYLPFLFLFLSFLFLLYSVKLELCTLYSVQPRIILDFAIVWFLTFPPHTCVYAYFWETLTTQWKTSYLSYTWASFAVVSFNTEEKFWGAIDVQYVDFVQFLLHFSVQPSISGNALKLEGEDQGNN